jgi:hypothetical protein
LRTNRKKKNKKKPTVKSVSSIQRVSLESQKLAAQMAYTDRAFYSLWFIELGAWNFWKSDVINNWSGIHTGGWTIIDDIYLFSNGAVALVSFCVMFINRRKYKRNPTIETAIRTTRRTIILLSVMIAIFFATFLYGLGVTYKVDQYLLAKAPAIGANISKAAATLLNIIVSGVIGNFVYDILKKMILNKMKAGQKEG